MWVILDCCHSGTALDLPYKVQLSQDGRSLRCVKSRFRRGPNVQSGSSPSKADVIMISGCKDTQTSADVSASSAEATKAAGAMTTAFRHTISPSISCEDLLLCMRRFLQQHGFKQVPQMSSEQFVQVDSSFVGYATKGKGKKPLPVTTASQEAVGAQPAHAVQVGHSPVVPSVSPAGVGALSAPLASCEGRKRAVTVGINYLGLQCQLSGCINDSDTIIHLLVTEFGYDVADIRQLRDDRHQGMPTRRNITTALQWLVAGAKEGDHLFFHYSGHGSQQRDAGGDEMDGKDETLVPVDYQQNGMLSDDELRQILVASLPKGVRLTVILDCCHSGTALDLPYKVAIKDGDIVDIKKKLPHQIAARSQGDVVMISGCMDTQTSADVGGGSLGNSQPAGAMTTAFKTIITRRKDASYHQVISEMRQFLRSQRFSQVPQLSSEHFLNLTSCFLPEAEAPDMGPEKPLRPPVRKALTIGINYLCLQPGQGQLSGCINDSDTMVGILKSVFQFQDTQICRLRDDNHQLIPTKANMLAAFRWLTQGAGPGDEMFLHYSGHGGQQRDTNGDEVTGKDDTLIPCDFQTAGQIVDDELHAHLVRDLPRGCRLWVILDCCHSGTALDLRYKVQLSPNGRSAQCKKTRSCRGPGGMKGPTPTKAEVIMISGCQDSQTSADVSAGSMGVAKAAGAMTTAFHHCISRNITCEDLLLAMRSFLQQNRFEQVPQMSSEQFLQLDSSFVNYAAKTGGRRDLPAAALASMPLSPQSHALVPQQVPTFGAPLADMHHRINNLQEQIAALRKQQISPIPGGGDFLPMQLQPPGPPGPHFMQASGSPSCLAGAASLTSSTWQNSLAQAPAPWQGIGSPTACGLPA